MIAARLVREQRVLRLARLEPCEVVREQSPAAARAPAAPRPRARPCARRRRRRRRCERRGAPGSRPRTGRASPSRRTAPAVRRRDVPVVKRGAPERLGHAEAVLGLSGDGSKSKSRTSRPAAGRRPSPRACRRRRRPGRWADGEGQPGEARHRVPAVEVARPRAGANRRAGTRARRASRSRRTRPAGAADGAPARAATRRRRRRWRAEAGRDHGDPHLVAMRVVDDGAEDDVRVLVGRARDDLGRLVHLEQADVGPPGDVEQDAGGALDRRLEQRRA